MRKKENHKEHLTYSGRMEKGKERAAKSCNKVEKSISHAMPKEKSVGLNTY